MAIMHPNRIPDFVLRDPYREAEIAVYKRLRDQLPDAYHCYYSRPWLGLTPEGEEREGEADFIVAHPSYGFLVIEVKGGGVSRRADTEEWVSRNRLGITNKIKDPVQQASRSKHALLAKLKEQPGWTPHFVTARHGVILPDCSRPKHAIGANMPLWLFAFDEDLDALDAWVESRLGRDDDEADVPGRGLGQDGMNAMNRLLAAPFELRPSLARALKDDRREVERVTAEQYDILESLEDHSRMAISGGAGTGKTLLALEKTCRLAEGGMRVLLACYNEALGDHLKRLTAGYPKVLAASFHSVCGKLVREAKIPVPSSGESATFYSTDLPEALVKAIEARPDLRFDAVVVDEGQDFRDNWLMALKLCLKDGDQGPFYVFYDDNQRVYRHSGGWLAELPQQRFHLTRNLRNTKAIHLCAKPWYRGRVTRSAGPEGVPVEWIVAKSSGDAVATVKSALGDLLVRQKIPPGDIAVLTGGCVEGNPLVTRGAINGTPSVSAATGSDGCLVFDTVRRFKGLERPIVLLTDVEDLTDAELVYVALSRPAVLLMVFGSPAALERIRRGPGEDD